MNELLLILKGDKKEVAVINVDKRTVNVKKTITFEQFEKLNKFIEDKIPLL